jgi:NADH-quinone oxidoreductase subunit N
MNAELTGTDIVQLLPELILAIGALVLLLVGAFRGNAGTIPLCMVAMLVYIIVALYLLVPSWTGEPVLNGLFVLDGFAGFIKLVILIGMLAVMGLSTGYLHEEGMVRFEYPVLMLTATLGILMMVSAYDLLSLYLGLELQSLSLYIMTAMKPDSTRSAEAGMKYFVLGAISSGMILFGASLIYGYTGTTNYAGIADAVAGSDQLYIGVLIGLMFMLAGLAFKVSAVPFHMWTPDVYEGAPTPVTALFAMVPKIAAMAAIARLLFEAFGTVSGEWTQIIGFLSLASMTWAALAGLVQLNIKRLMAYSSIGNMGYAMLGLLAANPEGVGATFFYMCIYMIMTAGAFGVILCMRRNNLATEAIDDLAGLSHNMPALAYAMGIFMFSMSGIPPFAGFFAKFTVFKAAVGEGYYTLAIIGVITSVIAAYYYLRIIRLMFFGAAADPFDKGIAFARRAVILIAAVIVVGFVAMPNMLINSTRAAAQTLF